MKIQIAIAVSLLTLTSVSAVSANADDRGAVISTTVAPAYIVTIPPSVRVPFNQEKTDFGAVKLESAQIEPDKCIKVTLLSDNELDNKADTSKTIPYLIYEGTADNANTVYTSATYLETGDKTNLTIGIAKDDWNKAYAGDYEDTVTFQIAYTDK